MRLFVVCRLEIKNGAALKIVHGWVEKLELKTRAGIRALTCKDLGFEILSDKNKGVNVHSDADVRILVEMILNRPHARHGYYPFHLFYASCISDGHTTPNGCWLPDNLNGAFASTRCLNKDSDDEVFEHIDTWYEESELPYTDALSTQNNDNFTKKPTACHHPFLCEHAELKADKKSNHPPHSHICTRLTHLQMAPKMVNSRQLVLQNYARRQGILPTSNLVTIQSKFPFSVPTGTAQIELAKKL
jgi:hypothetical protein